MTSMEERGFSFTADQIHKKWRYLSQRYNQVRDNRGKTGTLGFQATLNMSNISVIEGRGRMKFKYFDIMYGVELSCSEKSCTMELGDHCSQSTQV